MEAKRTSLIELLERVPRDAVLVVEHDQFSSSSHPVGHLCHEAAATLTAACDPDTIRKLLAERDELLEALQLLFNAAYFGFATSIEFGRAEAAIAKANGRTEQ